MTILDSIRHHFSVLPRPAHYVNADHCCECAEHQAALAPYDTTNLPLSVVQNPAWDPITFCTPEAFRYLFPRLCELASAEAGDAYLEQFLFHLEARLDVFDPKERELILALLVEWADSLKPVIDRYDLWPDFDRISETLSS